MLSPTISRLSTRSSPQSNIHNRDNNENNCGVIDGSGNYINSGDHSCQVNNIINVTESKNELHELLYPHISNDALHDFLKSPPQCHPGTRKTVRNAITEWASNPEASPLLWLYGPAGVGKSVIAKTISTDPSDQIQAVATFFFSTSSDKSAATLFPTLAWQLAKNVPETEQYIVAALKCNRSLTKSELDKQFDKLIVQPLRKCKSTMTSDLVMVIDGVDECTDEDMQRGFLNILKGAGENGDLPLRFLICSRPEPRLRAILEDDYATARPQANSFTFDIPQNPSPVPHANTGQSEISIVPARKHQLLSRGYQAIRMIQLYLSVAKARIDASLRWRPVTVVPSDAWKLYRPMQVGVDKAYPSSEIPDELDQLSSRSVISRIQIGLSEESKDDVRIYLTDKFSAVPRSENDAIAPEDIEDLVKISCGHFLYASTIVKLLDDPCWNAKDVLKMACSSSLPTPDLDKLYSAILDNAAKVMRREDNNGAEIDLVTLKEVFGILVVLWENVQLANIPESFPIIECLLILENGKLKLILRKMHSIFDIIPGKSIRVYHRSFFEFLQHHNQNNQNNRHYIAYSIALQRFLFLLGQVGLRYTLRRCCGLLQDDEKKQAKHIRNMVLAFPRTFFRRSANPTKLATFHALVHTLITVLLWTSSFWLTLDFWDYLIVSLVPPLYVSFVRYLLIMVLFLPVAFGCFAVSLKCYIFYLDRVDRTSIYPLFHPFLHPIFVTAIECLLSG